MSQDEFTDRMLPAGAGRGQSSWARRHRAAVGRFVQSTLLVGGPYEVAALHQQLLRRPPRDYEVIGCCLPTPGQAGATLDGLPVLGGRDDVADVACRYDVDAVAVFASSGLDGAGLRRLENALEPTRAALLLAPAATATERSGVQDPSAGRRSRPPRERTGLHGVRRLVKASFDCAVVALLLVLLAPVLIGIAVCVKATSRGPVFLRQPRVGRDGGVFHLLTFRTTDIDTERRGDHPRAGCDRDEEIHRGPGELRLASTLRRHSLDQLPQLFNVLKGDMSLVGPRPGLPSGIPRSGADVQRCHPVKPGVIDLAQVRDGPVGSRDDAARIDVGDYAERWSPLLDLKILRHAFAAALRGDRTP